MKWCHGFVFFCLVLSSELTSQGGSHYVSTHVFQCCFIATNQLQSYDPSANKAAFTIYPYGWQQNTHNISHAHHSDVLRLRASNEFCFNFEIRCLQSTCTQRSGYRPTTISNFSVLWSDVQTWVQSACPSAESSVYLRSAGYIGPLSSYLPSG